MKFHPDKCEHITFTRKKKPLGGYCNLREHQLRTVSRTKYLGVNITAKLDWNEHVEKVVKKSNQTLGFLRRNLKNAPEKMRAAAYKILVRPQAEYATTIWDPHTKELTKKLEKDKEASSTLHIPKIPPDLKR